MADIGRARAAKRHLQARLSGLQRHASVGISRVGSGYVLSVGVPDDASLAAVPASIDGVEVHVRVTGRVRPLAG